MRSSVPKTVTKTVAKNAQRADSLVTRERLLESSLRLFSERGYEGTSVRAITDAAGVNLAAANYHFGSKQKLLQATFQTALAPINTARLRRLAELESTGKPAELTDLVRAFVEPFFQSQQNTHLPKLLANLFAEPKDIAVPLLESTFAPVVERYMQAMGQALPDVDERELRWRIHFVVGSMLQLAHFRQPLFTTDTGDKSTQENQGAEAGIEQLVKFTVAGLQQHKTKRGSR